MYEHQYSRYSVKCFYVRDINRSSAPFTFDNFIFYCRNEIDAW